MASRRKLKKTIHFVCNELITEVCIRQLISGNKNEASVDSQIVKIAELGSELPVFGINQKHIDKNTGIDLVLSKLIVKAYNGSIHFLPNIPTGVIVQIVLNTNIKV